MECWAFHPCKAEIMFAFQPAKISSGKLWPSLPPHTLVMLPQKPGQGRDAEGDLTDSRQVDGAEAGGCGGGVEG